MDTRPLTAPQAPADAVRSTLRFEGSAGEYFKIWIVNIALTIVTLGIFSAWAKVRSKRYFYGNTYIGTHAFDYHAAPLRILLGRAIAFGFLLAYSLTIAISPKLIGFWYLLFLAALPWLIASSLRFAARNTSYCNVRFDFKGDYWGALKAFVLWPLLTTITLFVALPYAHRARDYYNINNSSFGQTPFKATIPVGKLYKYYGLALLAILAALVMLVTLTGGTLNIFKPDNPLIMTARIGSIIFGAIAFWGAPAYLGALTFNLALNNTRLGEGADFQSHLSPVRMTWIIFSNILLTAITLGLMYPWARVRRARYMASCISVMGPTDIGIFQSMPMSAGNAVGEEMASFFDIDFGL
ncbi:MAG: YjgN family protein [Pseudomonadota bacterium]